MKSLLFSCLLISLASCTNSETSCELVDGGFRGTCSDTPSGNVSTVAGNKGTAGSSDGSGTNASFNAPTEVTTDGTYLYIADFNNHVVRRLALSDGAVITLAGQLGTQGSADGTGTDARFFRPTGITHDGTYLYVSEFGNHTIRRIHMETSVVETLAGTAGINGATDGTGAEARFNTPEGLTLNGTDLYVVEFNNHCIRKVDVNTSEVSTVAGTCGTSGSSDGLPSQALFYQPTRAALRDNSLWISDFGNHTIRELNLLSGEVVTRLGSTGNAGNFDGQGTYALLNQPSNIIWDGEYFYTLEFGNHSLKRFHPTDLQLQTVVGSTSGTDDGSAPSAAFNNPAGMVRGADGIYITEMGNHSIRKVE